MPWKILITCPAMRSAIADCRDFLARNGIEADAPECAQQMSEAELVRIIGRYDGVVAGDDPFTERVLEKGKAGRLKVLVKWGTGTDAIDLEAARRLGIRASNTPGLLAEEVADVVSGYLVLLARKLHRIDAALREGRWLKIQGVSLRGKTAGLIGVGNVGKAVARRFAAMGLGLLGSDIREVERPFVEETGLATVPLRALLARSDVIVLSCPLTRENRHLLDRKAFAAMKRGVWIINVARGALIDESALVDALREARVVGAALDVFETEPMPPAHPLLGFEQVILGSHNASNTKEAVERTSRRALEQLVRDLGNGAPRGSA